MNILIMRIMNLFENTLSRELLLKHRLHPSVIKNKLEEYNNDCKYAFLPISSQQIYFYFYLCKHR